jgi:DNA (cytosine-5)-methyltransferase 1
MPLQEVSKRTGVSTDDPRAGIGIGQPGDPMFTLQSGAQHAVSVSLRGRDGGGTAELSGNVATALRSSQGGGDKPHCLHLSAVRRLTPREAERLMGFPDDYTLIPYRNKPAKDAPRYKALGNSMAVPVMRWIGKRIETAT